MGAGPGPSDQVGGGMDKMIGKLTNNPNKLAEGQARSGTT